MFRNAPIIRPAVYRDLPEVKALLNTTWHDTYDPFLGWDRVELMIGSWHALPVLAEQIKQKGNSFLVADLEHVLVGHAFARETEANVLLLSRLYILPERQRLGIGQALLTAVLARHQTAKHIHLVVEARNAKAMAFYYRHGFKVTGEVEEEGSELLCMEKLV